EVPSSSFLPRTSTPSSIPSISKNAPPPPPLPATPSTSTTSTSSGAIPSISATAPPPPPLPGTFLRPSGSCGIPPPPPLPPGGLLIRGGGPPPPPPLPPGGIGMMRGGPPPPPLPGAVAVIPRIRELKKERNTMSVLWESVPSMHDESLWSERSEMDMNDDELEELQRSFERPRVVPRSEKRTTSAKESSAYALTHQRAMNIEITLKKIKKETEASYESMLERLERDEMAREHVDLLGLILKHYPTDNELAPFKPISLEVVVGEANRFCWHLSRKPVLRVKAQLMIAKETLNADLRSVEASMATLETGIAAAKSDFIKDFLFKVLEYGNYLNQGTPHRRVDGFAISSLISVLNQKGPADAGAKRIVDVLARYWKTSDEVMKTLKILSTASKIDLDEVEKSSNETKQSVIGLKSALRKSEDTQLQEKYREFIEECDTRCTALTAAMEDIRAKESKLRVRFAGPTLSLKRITEILAEALELLKKSLEASAEAEAEAEASKLRRFASMRALPRKDSTLGVPGSTLMSMNKRRQSMTMTLDETRSLFSRAIKSPSVTPPTTVPSRSPTVTPMTMPTIEAASEEVEI
ncbi:hypothetical protein PENTCL1PPCAC_255, partial [Pristionchus entomophagus]